MNKEMEEQVAQTVHNKIRFRIHELEARRVYEERSLWERMVNFAHEDIPGCAVLTEDGDWELMKATSLLARRGWPKYLLAFVEAEVQRRMKGETK